MPRSAMWGTDPRGCDPTTAEPDGYPGTALVQTWKTEPLTSARRPALLAQNAPEPWSPTVITDRALPVTPVTTSEASYSFEPVAQIPRPGLVTEPASDTEPGCVPPQLIVPPVASEVPTAFPLPNGVSHSLK